MHPESNFCEFDELIPPQLISNEKGINPSINSSNNIEKDIISLMNFSQHCHNLKVNSHWGKTLPIYPTSPIEPKTKNL